MSELKDQTADIAQLMEQRAWPSVTRWERVDGIPRTHSLERALRAEVRDPLWMLARQWQLGELQGDDAGSPVFAKLHLETTRLTSYRSREAPEQPFDDSGPLEARVERRPIPFLAGSQPLALDIRLLMGRHWSKLLAKNGLGAYVGQFRDGFGIDPPVPDASGALVCAHREAWQHQAAFATRAMDGYGWYRWIVTHAAPRDFSGLPPPLAIATTDAGTIDGLADAFVAWFHRLIDQPDGADGSAWDPSRLEYRFACSAPAASGRTDLVASEYASGDLDWYALDVGAASAAAALRPEARTTTTNTFLPTAVEFNGMPNTRWWSFEDRRVNFGNIQPDTTDLAKLLLIEFGLVYANDWCILPVPLDAGSLVQVRGLAVTSVFGERFWIERAGGSPDDSWQRWSMFSLSPAPQVAGAADPGLLMLGTVPKVQEGPRLEEVALMRDEMANMVWGVETTVPLPHGEGRAGAGAAAETAAFHLKLLGAGVPPTLLENDARARYEVMTSVPENWIPLVPVKVPGSDRAIQLQRASMPRVLPNDPDRPQRIKPRTSLLREGLDQPNPAPYFVHEEEVPRAGASVGQRYQRTRWTDGRVVLWLGAAKKIGRGEGASGLEFDRLVETKK